MAAVKKIGEHAVEIEIEKARPVVEQEGPIQQHLLERHETIGQLGEQPFLIRAPNLEAATPELPLLVPQKTDLIRFRHEFLPINIIQLKTHAFNVVLDITPENRLLPVQFP